MHIATDVAFFKCVQVIRICIDELEKSVNAADVVENGAVRIVLEREVIKQFKKDWVRGINFVIFISNLHIKIVSLLDDYIIILEKEII